MRLYLIRHCESENNALWKQIGSSEGRSADPLLTPRGHEQAKVLAAFLAANHHQTGVSQQNGRLQREGFNFSALYCSYMTRSIETGFYIAQALNMPMAVLADIHERGGIYLRNPELDLPEGLPGPGRPYFEQQFPELILPEELGEGGWWNRPYENRQDALIRAQAFLDRLLHEQGHTANNIALITHGGFIQSLFQALFGIRQVHELDDMQREIWLKANNGSITRIDFDEAVLRLAYSNYIDFMPGELQT